jgi:hypothetical protein
MTTGASKQPQNQGSSKPKGDLPQQQQSGEGEQYGEGNYKATRDYNRGLKDHVEHHDIEKEARDAEPRSEEEARQMDEAEREGKSRAKGGGSAKAEDDPNVN